MSGLLKAGLVEVQPARGRRQAAFFGDGSEGP
jgi:hypothetical protein